MTIMAYKIQQLIEEAQCRPHSTPGRRDLAVKACITQRAGQDSGLFGCMSRPPVHAVERGSASRNAAPDGPSYAAWPPAEASPTGGSTADMNQLQAPAAAVKAQLLHGLAVQVKLYQDGIDIGDHGELKAVSCNDNRNRVPGW